MIKRLFARFRRERGLHRATVQIDFSPEDQVKPAVFWHQSQDQEKDTVILALYFYARILYELAELNETRVAKELLGFMDQVGNRIMADGGLPKRPRLPLGEVRLAAELPMPAARHYRADFYQFQDGNFLLEFQGSLGKEGFYLPAAFLAFLQSCVDNLADNALVKLARGIGRLNSYYQVRRDFWESPALSAGPAFALGNGELRPEEAAPEA
ncbi:MAG: hypothetical protein A2Y80_01845 [Deltaproteobacteria bacterium RBG_13_58_19]|nr:MAG: hypothetical protein A2Y80_01845 [Deltaproteobacteria bacterium RBG_13_58_19]